MENFTPVSALSGGALIGLSVAILLLFNGRIAGISGIMSGLLNSKPYDRLWRLAFLIGLMLGAIAFNYFFSLSWVPRSGYPAGLIMVGGFLVGMGTRIGKGCTSGHGICGLSLLSIRSVVATLTFMLFGMLSVFAVKHLL